MDKEIDKSILRRERRRKQIIFGTVGVAVAGLAIWGMSGMAPTINSRDITIGTADEMNLLFQALSRYPKRMSL